MNLIFIGKLVNTHGLKGEIKIISDFKYKNEVFKKDKKIYIDNSIYIINSHRSHKMFDMVTLEGIKDIDSANELKGLDVYINRDDYNFAGYLDVDLINLDVYDNNIYKGKVIDILKTKKYDLLVIEGIKRHMVPNISVFVKNIDFINQRIDINYIKGLDDEA